MYSFFRSFIFLAITIGVCIAQRGGASTGMGHNNAGNYGGYNMGVDLLGGSYGSYGGFLFGRR